MSGLRRAIRWASETFSGVVGFTFAAVLVLLAVVGNVVRIGDLLGYSVTASAVLIPASIIVVANVLYRERARSQALQRERDQARLELAARTDPAATLRQFLMLYDEGGRIVEHFEGGTLEDWPTRIPEGRDAYAAWWARCAALIEAERPSFALTFRASTQIDPLAYRAQLVKSDAMTEWVNVAEKEKYVQLAKQAMLVLGAIVESG